MKPSKLLSPKQKEVLEWIQGYVRTHQTMPSRREIAIGLGLSSPATIQQHIEALEQKGFLRRGETRESRALQVTAKSKRTLQAVSSGSAEGLKAAPPFSGLSVVDSQAVSSTISVPLLGSIAAGYPIEVFSEPRSVDLPLSFFRSPRTTRLDDVYVLTVRGDSMIDDGILPDDWVIIRKSSTAKNGDTIAALWNGEATLKKFYKAKDGVELHPANPKYPLMKVQGEDRFEIQGILMGVIRKYENN